MSQTEQQVYDFRNPANLYLENDILKSTNADMIHVTKCFHCNEENVILVNNIDFSLWRNQSQYVQDVFTWLDDEKREILVTGIHPKCWDEMFPED
jgi:hypothetical protein